MHLWVWTTLTMSLSAAGWPIVAAAAQPPLPAKGAYLGQQPPGMTAELFAAGLVSSSSFEHSRLEVSKDGKALYWVVQPTRRKQQIWTTHREADGRWSKPAPLPISRGATALPFLSSPTLAPDGKELYFFSCNLDPLEQTLYAVDLEDPRWDAPTPRATWFPKVNTVWGYSFAANGNLYFDSNFKLFTMACHNGLYGPPVALGDPINQGEAFVPFVAPDESYILFSSVRSDAVGGIDLYVAFRRAEGGWGEPKNLGPAVNTTLNERFPSLSPDGRYLFFLRNPPTGDADFYWIDAAIVARAR